VEALVTIGACCLLIVLVVVAMRDKKVRLRLRLPAASPSPAASASPAPSASPPPTASPTPTDSATGIQSLFTQGRAESSLIAPAGARQTYADIDFAQPSGYREIREADLGRIYSSLPKKNRRALARVAEIGGFRTSEDMARSFGYQSVDQMLWSWDQTILESPRFSPNAFGTNAPPVVPSRY